MDFTNLLRLSIFEEIALMFFWKIVQIIANVFKFLQQYLGRRGTRLHDSDGGG